LVLLVFLFIAVPILELYVIVKVGGLIGIIPTLALLLAMSLLGAALLRHQGRGAWRRFNEAIAARRFPGREVADGVMITLGGALLLTPGFITDAFGLLLLFPPVRALARALLRTYAARRFVVVGLGGAAPRPSDGQPRRDYDYEATAEEIDPDDPQLPR
jgi:UPF0716 protein FxsA